MFSPVIFDMWTHFVSLFTLRYNLGMKMEAFIYTLAFAVVSATTFVAYKHHGQYEVIGPGIIIGSIIIGLMCFCFWIGVSQTFAALLSIVAPGKLDSAQDITSQLKGPAMMLLIVFFVYGGYAAFLLNLRSILGLDKSKND